MRNVLTAGENSPRVVDHFPVSRASRWKPNQNGAPAPGNGGAYDMIPIELEAGGGMGPVAVADNPLPPSAVVNR